MIEPVEIKVGGERLRGNFYKPATSPKLLALLFLHGWTGRPNDFAASVLALEGFYVMTVSLSGHNNSSGKLEDQTRERSLNEVIAAYDFLKQKLPKNLRICVVGNSYGSYLATLLTVEREVACLSLRVPANYPDEGFDESQLGKGDTVMDWRKEKLKWGATRSLRALHMFNGPVQIIEAEHDDRIPHKTVQNYIDAVSEKQLLDYHFMIGWAHSLGNDEERNRQFRRILLDWLNSCLRKLV